MHELDFYVSVCILGNGGDSIFSVFFAVDVASISANCHSLSLSPSHTHTHIHTHTHTLTHTSSHTDWLWCSSLENDCINFVVFETFCDTGEIRVRIGGSCCRYRFVSYCLKQLAILGFWGRIQVSLKFLLTESITQTDFTEHAWFQHRVVVVVLNKCTNFGQHTVWPILLCDLQLGEQIFLANSDPLNFGLWKATT